MAWLLTFFQAFIRIFGGIASRFNISWYYTLLAILPFIIIRIFYFIGLSFVTYEGLTIVTDSLKTFILSKTTSIPSAAFLIMGRMNLDIGLSMIISAGILSNIIRGYKNGKKRTTTWGDDGLENGGLGGSLKNWKKPSSQSYEDWIT